jgi:aminoglycoside phosphotransferase (APT) family kinase protein
VSGTCAITPTPPSADQLAPLLRRTFPAGVSQSERVAGGASTWVFRIQRGGETFYLRILPEADASFSPEVIAHQRMRALGVRAPEVVYYEPCAEPFQRSVMVVREIAGAPLSQSSGLDIATLDAIAEAAGSDLARINSVSVDGFGWVARELESANLRAPLASNRAFALEAWAADLTFLADSATLHPDDIRRLEQTLDRESLWLDEAESRLAHGDFDATAIYQFDGGYTGVIDFGEMRGTSRWYDLAHCHMRDGEYLTAALPPPLLRGYARVTSLPPDAERRIRFASLFINVRALSRSLQKRPPNRYTRHQVDVLRADLAALARPN